MPAKPYSSGHIGAVASNFTDMRLSGDVKQTLVELSCDEIARIVPLMESETLTQDPERKTLDDPKRTRLNYNRTRELMIEQLGSIESVGSAAVQAGIEQVEGHLSILIKHAEAAAAKDRVATIKPRHLEIAVSGLGLSEEESDSIAITPKVETEEFTISQGGGVLTHSSLMALAKTHAGMPVTNAALDELIDTYYMVVEDLESKIRKHAQLGGNPVQFIESINQMKTLMSLGWMRNMLAKASHVAREAGLKRIDEEQIIHIDPFE